MSRSAPWIKFYPTDWRSDAALRSCSTSARGIWLEMIGLMHEAEPYGHLLLNGAAPSIKTLSGLFNVHHKTLIAGMKELLEHGVYSTTDEGIIYSRRMVRDHAKALQDKENGRRGGNPNIPKGVNPPVNGGDKAHIPEARSQIPEKEETPTLRFGVSSPTPPEPRPKQAVPKRASKQKIPIDLAMTDPARAFAASRGFLNGTAEALWERFTAHHAAKDTQTGSVEASWRTWVLNEIKFNGERNVERVGVAGNLGAGPRAASRPQPRSAATIIMERALADELDADQRPPVFDLD